MKRTDKRIAGYMMSVLMCSAGVLSSEGQTVEAATGFADAVEVSVDQEFSDNLTKGYHYQTNIYSFSLANDGVVRINMNVPMQGSTGNYWNVKLYDGSYSCMVEKNFTGNYTNQQMLSMGLAAGTYYLTVCSTDYSRAASEDIYNITIGYEASDYWEKEFNDGFLDATAIGCGSIYSGTLRYGYHYEKDTFKFNADAAGLYDINFLISLQGSTGNAAYVSVYDSNYIEVTDSFIPGNKDDNTISCRLDKGCNYICVQSCDYSHSTLSGEYGVKVKAVSDTNDSAAHIKNPTLGTEVGKNNTDTPGQQTYMSDTVTNNTADNNSETSSSGTSTEVTGTQAANVSTETTEVTNASTENTQATADASSHEVNATDTVADKNSSNTATSNASAGDRRGEVNISTSIKSLSLATKTLELSVDEEFTLDVILNPEDADVEELIWESGNEDVVDVDEDGVVTGIHPGRTKVIVSNYDNRIKDECIVTVYPKKVKLSGLRGSKKAIYARWEVMSEGVDGYQIQYSTSKKFDSGKKVYVKDGGDSFKKVSNLGKKKKYYVRVRAYTKIDGKKYFGAWSNIKSARTR